jgi:septal ring factor EnvC (AmiA/AmiB activator)
MLFCMVFIAASADAQKRGKKRGPAKKRGSAASSTIARERSSKEDELSRLKREIARFQAELKDHEAQASRSKRNLTAFNRRTAELRSTIARLEEQVDALQEKKEIVQDSIRQTNSTLDRLRSAYASGARYLYVNGAMAEASPDETLLTGQENDHLRQQYYASLVARAHALNRDKLDSARRSLGRTSAGISTAITRETRAIDQRTSEAERIEEQRQEEARRLAQIEQDRERVRKLLKQKQESARRLERMIADLIVREQTAARARKEAATKHKKQATKHHEPAPKFEDDLAEPGRVYGPHSLHWPTASHQIRQGYGEHTNRELNTVTMNLGIDIAAAAGSAVSAAADGIVSLVSSLPSYGTIIVLQHAGGLHTVYADLSGVNVRVGSRVSAGQTIARSGSNEESGAMLHFEVWKGKSRQNPIGWLR